MFIIDGHAHIFPDKIAKRASKNIGDFYDLPMRYDGTVNTLLKLGEKYGISMFLVHSVATIPDQVMSINNFIADSVKRYPDKLIGFASLHPDMDNIEAEVERVIKMGLKGIKLHPDFQKFFIDEVRMNRIYSMIEGRLPILIHTGDSRYNYSSPKRVVPVLKQFPKLDMICAHLGGWSQWAEASHFLMGKRLWVDTCSTFSFIDQNKALKMIEGFGYDRVIFGCDYPMWDLEEEIAAIDSLGLSEEIKKQLFYKNLCQLLKLEYKER